MSYQKTTGCLTAGAHPGSYNGQDAYNDMIVTCQRERERERERQSMDNDYRNEHCDIQRNGIDSEEQGLQGSADSICAKKPVTCDEKMGQTYVWEDQANTLASRDYKDPQRVAYEEEEEEYIARRLTPTECARLQGFPDDWCADVPHSDSAEYKLWGNGIALPSILGIMKNCFDHIEAMDF